MAAVKEERALAKAKAQALSKAEAKAHPQSASSSSAANLMEDRAKKRALTITQSMPAVKRPEICKHFAKGLCRYGRKCTFLHVPDAKHFKGPSAQMAEWN